MPSQHTVGTGDAPPRQFLLMISPQGEVLHRGHGREPAGEVRDQPGHRGHHHQGGLRQVRRNNKSERNGWTHPILPNRPRQNSLRGKELKKICPPNRRDDLFLGLCLNPSSMVGIDCGESFRINKKPLSESWDLYHIGKIFFQPWTDFSVIKYR